MHSINASVGIYNLARKNLHNSKKKNLYFNLHYD